MLLEKYKTMKKVLLLFAITCFALTAKINFSFIENKGQWDSKILFLAKTNNANIWITDKAVVIDYFRILDRRIEGHVVSLEHLNANSHATPKPLHRREARLNYFIGNKKITDVPVYEEVLLENLYEGIHQRFYFEGEYLRYDYIVEAGADPARIKLKIPGAEKLNVEENSITFMTRFGKVLHTDLKVFQGKRKLKARWKQNGNILTIDISEYDKSKGLIIDPLIFSTFLGGNQFEEAFGVATDANNNIYVAGRTTSVNFPVTQGAYNQNINNASYYDVFVSKLSPTGNLLFSTFLGGTQEDFANNIFVDGQGNVYIVGETASSDFPVTIGSFAGTRDAFVAKLNSSGSSLQFSLLLGGSAEDRGKGIAVDNNGNIYVAGATSSANFPTTQGVIDNTFAADPYGGVTTDGFITKVASSGQIQFSTFLGGSGIDETEDIALDPQGNIIVTGFTSSGDFPVTGVLANGGQEIFVTKINNTGSSLLYSVAIGSSSIDYSHGIAVDNSGRAYVVGYCSYCSDFPITQGALDPTSAGGSEGIVFVINSQGDSLLYSSYLGGSNDDLPADIALDKNQRPVISGWTYSPDFPTTPGAFDNTFNNDYEAFVIQFEQSFRKTLYSSFIGGVVGDAARAVTADNQGQIIIAGYTDSPDFPTKNAFDNTFNTNRDVFVAKFATTASNLETIAYDNGNFQVFPVPAKDNLHIKLKKIYRNLRVELYSVQGKFLHSEYFDRTNEIVFPVKYQTGIYLLKIFTGEELLGVSKILIKK